MLTEGPTEAEAAAVSSHFAYFSGLVDEGRMLLAGRTTGEAEKTIGIAILSANSLEEAERIASQDPAILANVMVAEVQPFSLALFNSKATE